jgi:DHA2 family multidrug resistance protein
MNPILPALARTTTPETAYARRFLITITVTLATVLLTLDMTIVAVAVPAMMGNLGATLDEIAWVSTGYILASVIMLPISSWMADWFGRRNYYALSILVFTLASLMCGLSSSLEQLVFWRLVQGLAGGGMVSTAQVTLLEVFPPSEVGIGMSIWGVGLMLGPAFGPPLGGWLTEALSWPWIFYVNLPVGVLVFLLVLMFVPDSRFARKPDKVDFFGLVLLAVGVGCLQALLERGEHLDWLSSREVIAYCMICPLALGLLVWHELRCKHPVLNVRVLANRQFAVSLVLLTMTGFSTVTYGFAFPVLMQAVFGYSAVQAGWAIMPYMAGNLVGFVLTGRLTSRAGLDLRWIIALGALLTGLGYWQHSYLTSSSGAHDVILAQLMTGIGQPLCMLPVIALSSATLRQEQVAGANAIINFGRQLGGSLGIALYATLLTHFQGVSRAELIRHVTIFSDTAQAHLALFRQLVISQGTPITEASRKALLLLDMEVRHQARVIAFNQSMVVFAICILAPILAVPLLSVGRIKSEIRTDGALGH